jgi:hypothetical protein
MATASSPSWCCLSPQGWLPELIRTELAGLGQIRVTAQRGTGLDSRLAAAFEDAGAETSAFLIGMDTPQLTPELLVTSIVELMAFGCGAVLGHAADGGWWGLGLKRPDPRMLTGVAMSTPDTGRLQEARLAKGRLSVTRLPELTDVDTVDDAGVVAALAPNSRFARTFRDIRRLAKVL